MIFAQLFTKPVVIASVFISVIYFILTVYLMNSSLVFETLTGAYPFAYKLNILTALLQGVATSMTLSGIIVLISISILTGLNLSLLFQRITSLKKDSNLRIAVGGSSVVGVVGSGCAACGLPVISLFGLSGLVAYLPLRGFEISYFALIALSVSLYFLIKSSTSSVACKVDLKTVSKTKYAKI